MRTDEPKRDRNEIMQSSVGFSLANVVQICGCSQTIKICVGHCQKSAIEGCLLLMDDLQTSHCEAEVKQ
jgi:hypothetical protein